MKILCVEDDKNLALMLQQTLVKHHYQVDLAADGQEGYDFAEAYVYDLILLDLILPKLDGIHFCQQLRSHNSSALNPNQDTPVLLMTALDRMTDKIMGLDAGADDYIIKPFDINELLARIRALLRRNQKNRSPLLTWGDLCLNPNSCHVTYLGRQIALTPKEYEILELFLRNPDQIFSANRLIDRLWTLDKPPSEGAVRAQIKSLRRKLKRAGCENIFETIYKLGYRLLPQKTETQQQIKPDHTVEVEDLKENLPPTIIPQFQQVWLDCCQSYGDRIDIIEKAISALEMGNLTLEQLHQAEREAHTLVGSLGIFGLEEASKLSRQIKQLFEPDELVGAIPPWLPPKLKQLVIALKEQIKKVQAVIPINEDEQNTPHYLPVSPCVLIVDDDVALAKLLAAEAINWGFHPESAINLQQAEQILTSKSMDVIVLDLNFPDRSENGLDFLAKIRTQDLKIPVIILTSEESFYKRIEAARKGSQFFLQKQLTPDQVLAVVSQVIQQEKSSLPRILVVDDDRNLLSALSTLLESCGYQLSLLSKVDQFWETLEQTDPDLLILDVELSPNGLTTGREDGGEGLNGFDLCQVIRSDPRWNRLPVLFLSAHTDIETIQRGFDAGADDFLNKPIVATDLMARIHNRLQQRKRWGITELDDLTGISLRKKCLQDLNRLLLMAKRQQQPFSLALLDLDHFKEINDHYGHDMGDRVLSYLGKLLNQSFRQQDVKGRWGGEEFMIGMYNTTKEDGIRRLTGVLSHLSQHQFTVRNGISFKITFSAGIAQFPEDGQNAQTLYRAADIALYRAKDQGRNCIIPATLGV